MRFFNSKQINESLIIDRSIQFMVIVILTLIVIAQILYISPLLIGLFSSIILFIIYQYRKQSFSYHKKLQFFIFIIGIMTIYFKNRTFLGIEAGTSFLTLCLFAKSFELKSKRDILVIFNFALFVSASLFLHSQSFLMTVIVLCSLIACFIGLYRLQTSDFLRQAQKQISLKSDIQHIGKVILLAVPFFLILFIFFPRFPPFWAIPIPNNKATTGMTDRMSPGDIAELSQSSELAFRIIGNIQQLPSRSQLYWRGMVLDQYDGRTWTRSFTHHPIRMNKFESRQVTHYQYLPANPHDNWLMPLEKSIPASPRYALFSDGSVRSKRPEQQLQPIDFAWLHDTQSNDFEDTPSSQINTLFVQHLDPKSQTLAQQLWKQSQHQPEKYIENIIKWYRQGQFTYTLKPALLGENRVDDFLFSTRQGFCEHYASSFSLMMRYVGIPARVVIGYQGGQPAPDGKSWEVRQLDAHAWTEVWLNQRWVRIDPTAIVAPERIDSGMQDYIAQEQGVLGSNQYLLSYIKLNIGRKLLIWSDYASYQWQSKIVGYDVDSQKNFLEKFGLTSIRQYLMWLFIFSIFTITLIYLYYLRQQQLKYSFYQYEILKFNRQLNSNLRQNTGESFAQWLNRLNTSSAPCFDEIIALYQRVHYAEQHYPDDEKQFRSLLKQCTSKIKGQKKT